MQKFNLKLITPVLIISSCSIATGSQQPTPQNTCPPNMHQEEHHLKEHDQVFKTVRHIVVTLNMSLQEFFSQTNHDTIIIHAEKLKKVELQIIQMVEDLRKITKGHEALFELVSYADSFMHQFKLFVTIVDEFKHKPASHAMPFATKLKNKINIQKLFSDIIIKLDKLQAKYATKDKVFADHLSGFIRTLRTIVGQWNKKDEIKMFNDITVRMSRKSK